MFNLQSLLLFKQFLSYLFHEAGEKACTVLEERWLSEECMYAVMTCINAEKIQFVTQLPSKVPSSFLIRAKPTDVPVLLIKITLLAPQDLQVALLKDSDFLACKQTLQT